MFAGYEYNVSGWCRNRMVLDNKDQLINLLNSICYAIGMRALDSCSVHVETDLKKLGKEPFADEGGATAVLVLSTSHIAIHGWPNRDPDREDGGFFWLSVCSCRGFCVESVDHVVDNMLNVTSCNRDFRNILR